MQKILTSLLLGSFFIALSAYFYDIGQPVQAARTVNTPIVLELFTSQSCSSCPPADKILGELAERHNIIALSCNVTYWNHLHWKDTLSKEFCTKRQYDYNAQLNRRGVYTPQLIVNGRYNAVGNRNGEINRALGQASLAPVLPIVLTKQAQTLMIALPQGQTETNLYLVRYGENHTESIPSGENRGRTVHYTNPVQSISLIGTWNGKAETKEITIPTGAKNIAVIAQDKIGSPIIAAGKL